MATGSTYIGAPHAGFSILKRWGENLPGGYRVFTSNVDGQFQKAGFGDEKVFECHGSIHHLHCLKPCSSAIWRVDDFLPEVDMAACRLRNAPPTCPHCGGPTRPNILMFNDTGWCDSREVRQSIQQDRWLATVTRPVVIELGAGTDIPTVRNFGTRVVRHHGGHLVRINPRECGIANSAEIGLRMGAVEALRGIAAALGEPWAPYETVVI